MRECSRMSPERPLLQRSQRDPANRPKQATVGAWNGRAQRCPALLAQQSRPLLARLSITPSARREPWLRGNRTRRAGLSSTIQKEAIMIRLPQKQQTKGTRILMGEEATARRVLLDYLHL
jgi:hypothetical protein